MNTAHLAYISVSTVFKVVTAVVVGIGIAPFLSDRAASEKGLSFIALRILLPSMLFGNLALDISVDFLTEYYWAIIMSLVPQLLGVTFSLALRKLVDRDWRVLLVLASTFQNGLVFPLSIVTNIKGVQWLDREAIRRCEQYVFLYNLTCALGLWSIGNPTVKYYKDKMVARKLEQEEEKMYVTALQSRSRQWRQRHHRRRQHKVTIVKEKKPPAPSSDLAITSINTLAAVLDPNTSNDKVEQELDQIAPPQSEEEEEDDDISLVSVHSSLSASSLHSSRYSPSTTALEETGEEEEEESLAQLHRYWYRPPRRHDRPISVKKFDQLFCDDCSDVEPESVTMDMVATESKKSEPKVRFFFETIEPPPPSDQPKEKKTSKANTKTTKATRKSSRKGPIHVSAKERLALRRNLETVPVPGHRDVSSVGSIFMAINDAAWKTEAENDPEHPHYDVTLHNSDRPFSFHFKRTLHLIWVALNMPPAYISFVAIAVGLIPPLRWCAESVPGLAFISGIAALGTGCVPVQLVTLGITLSDAVKIDVDRAKRIPRMLDEYPWFRSRWAAPTNQPPPSFPGPSKEGPVQPAAPPTKQTVTAEEILHSRPVFHFNDPNAPPLQEQSSNSTGKIRSVVAKGWFGLSNAARFSFIAISLRLFILPAISFLIVYALLLLKVLPNDPPFVISILIGISSPAAVNGSLICTMHGYFSSQYARMIFIMYCLAVVSSTLWLYVSVYYSGVLYARQHGKNNTTKI